MSSVERFINRLIASGDRDWQDTIVGMARIFEIAQAPMPPNAKDSTALRRRAYNFVMELPNMASKPRQYIRENHLPDICASIATDDSHRLARELRKMTLAMITAFDVAAANGSERGRATRLRIDRGQLSGAWEQARPDFKSDRLCADKLASVYAWKSETILKAVRVLREKGLLPRITTRRKRKHLRK